MASTVNYLGDVDQCEAIRDGAVARTHLCADSLARRRSVVLAIAMGYALPDRRSVMCAHAGAHKGCCDSSASVWIIMSETRCNFDGVGAFNKVEELGCAEA